MQRPKFLNYLFNNASNTNIVNQTPWFKNPLGKAAIGVGLGASVLSTKALYDKYFSEDEDTEQLDNKTIKESSLIKLKNKILNS